MRGKMNVAELIRPARRIGSRYRPGLGQYALAFRWKVSLQPLNLRRRIRQSREVGLRRNWIADQQQIASGCTRVACLQPGEYSDRARGGDGDIFDPVPGAVRGGYHQCLEVKSVQDAVRNEKDPGITRNHRSSGPISVAYKAAAAGFAVF